MKSCYKLFFIFLLATAFSGCSNFMNGGIFKDEFDKAVELANANEVSVEINLVNKDSGTLSPTGVNVYKRGATFKIELSIRPGFSLNEENPFKVFIKEHGERKGVTNLGEYIVAEQESKYPQGGGYVNYVYKLTVRKEVESILINPNITNHNAKKSPKILGMDVNSRYGKGTVVDVIDGKSFELVDYFDVNLDLEDDEGVPQNYVKFRFLSSTESGKAFIVSDNSDNSENPEYFTVNCNWEDVGNGQYNSKIRVDLRKERPILHDGDKFMLEVTVFNDGKDADNKWLSSVKLYDGENGKYNLFEKQAYSKTKISVFNRLEGEYAGNSTSAMTYPPLLYDHLNSETELLNGRKLKLIILGIDENLGKEFDGSLCEIRYGFCQDRNEVANLKMDHVIPLYRAYDFEKELEDIKKIPKISLATNDEIMDEIDVNIEFYNDCYGMEIDDYDRTWIFNEIKGKSPNKYSGSSDVDVLLEIVKDVRVGLDYFYGYDEDDYDEKLKKNFMAHFNDGLINKSIFNIPLPERIDPYKDFIVKVSTDNGINQKDYVEYVFPAVPRIMDVKIDENGNGECSLHYSSENMKPVVYSPDPYDFNRFVENNDETFSIPESFEKSGREYSFYVGSANRHEDGFNVPFGVGLYCMFFTDSVCLSQFYPKRTIMPVEKLPSDVRVDIISNGVNSETHSIKMFFDKNAFKKYDTVFLKLGGTSQDLYQMSDGSTVFNIPTGCFYKGTSGAEREDFEYALVAVKDGKSYITTYTVAKDNESIVDNIKPIFPISGASSDLAESVVRTDISIDQTCSFLTYRDIVFDLGDGLDVDSGNNITFTIELRGMNFTVHDETMYIKQPVDKYVNIPIGHLENGDYKLNIKCKDKNGNVGSWSEPFYFKINRDVVSGFEIKNKGYEFTLNSNSYKNYDITFFDGSKSKWNTVSPAKEGYKNINLGKSGVLKINSLESSSSSDYLISYPALRCFPEEKVIDRDYQLLKNSLHLYSDKPFFIHILQSDTDWKTLDRWENHQMFDFNIEDLEPPKRPNLNEPKLEDFDFDFEEYEYAMEAYMNAFRNYEYAYKDYENAITYMLSFIGSEINPIYETGNHSTTPYVYNFPWDKLTKKYAVAIIIWADNKRYMVPIDMSLKD